MISSHTELIISLSLSHYGYAPQRYIYFTNKLRLTYKGIGAALSGPSELSRIDNFRRVLTTSIVDFVRAVYTKVGFDGNGRVEDKRYFLP